MNTAYLAPIQIEDKCISRRIISTAEYCIELKCINPINLGLTNCIHVSPAGR